MSTGKYSRLLRRNLLLPSSGTLSPLFLDYLILNEYNVCRCCTCWNFLKPVISRQNCPTWHLYISLYKQSCRLNLSCGRTLTKVRVRIHLSQCGVWPHTQIMAHFTLPAVRSTLRRSCPLFIDLTTRTGVSRLEPHSFHCAKNTGFWNEISRVFTNKHQTTWRHIPQ